MVSAQAEKRSNSLEREICRERFYQLKSEIEWFGHELEEHRRHFYSDGGAPSDGETHRLVLGISGDRDWTDKVSAKIDLIKADEARLTERAKSLQEDVKIKKAALKGVKQQRSRYSTCLESSCRALEKLRSIITIDFEESSPEDSDSSLESTMEDSVADSATNAGGGEITHSANADISPNGIAKGIGRLAEEANQQHMTTQSLYGTDGLEFFQLAEGTDGLPRRPSRPPLMVPLQTNAQEQPAVCTIQVSQNSSSAEERDRVRDLCQLSEANEEREHLISAEETEPPQTQSPKRSLIVFLQHTPTKVLARASHIPGIGPVFKRLENADEIEIQGSFKPSEIEQQPEVFNAAEAIQEPSDLQQTTSNTEKRTSLQEASTQPSDSTLHMSSSSALVEGRNQRRAVSLATSVAQGPDHSFPPEGCRRNFNPAVLRTSSEYFDLPKPLESPSISLVQEATTASILTGVQRPEEPHIPRLALEGLAQSPANLMQNKIVLPPITNFSPTHDILQSSALPSLAPKTHILETSISSNTMGQNTTNGGKLQTPVSEAGNRKPFWSPGLNFRERITDLLLNGEGDTELLTRSSTNT
ncbi:hypothetical protein V490_05023 [Pseudogymnoascus sp. VKM F-3557]|nr:hypothetical protein V490_05023 [Pseudogymnoascus sp. VKM F-3557]